MHKSEKTNGRQFLLKNAPFSLILLLALFLRLRGLDTTTIGSDQAFTLGTAMRWVNGGDMPLAANISSVGFINPPMIEYLYAAALRLWPDILSVATLTLVSGIIAIIAAGWVTYRLFGRLAAFWTMLTFAINPWSVFYSQLIWNQTMVPVFSTLMLTSLLLYLAVERRPVFLIASFVWAACVTQVHPGSSIQLVTMGLVLALYWRRLRVWPLLAGIGSFFVLYTPFLLFESGVGWRDIQRIIELMNQPARTSLASLLVSFDLLHSRPLLPNLKGVAVFDTLATLLLVVAIVICLWLGIGSFRRRTRDPETEKRIVAYSVLVLWFFVPVLFYLRSSDVVYVQPYYLIGQIPAHFMFIGIALDWAQGRVKRPKRNEPAVASLRVGRAFAWLLIPVPLLVLQGWQIAFTLQFQDERVQNAADETQIRHIRSAVDTGNGLLMERPECQLVVVAEGHSVEQSHLSLLREFTRPEKVILADGRFAIPLPAPCAFYLDALPGSRASNWLAASLKPVPDTVIDSPGAAWSMYELTADDRAQVTAAWASGQSLAQWMNGVALRRLESGNLNPGASVPIMLYWSVASVPARIVYHTGAYLLDDDGGLIAQDDGPGFDSIQWRAGDDFITWADIPVPPELSPGEYQIAVAYYSWPGVERVALTSGGDLAILERFRYTAP